MFFKQTLRKKALNSIDRGRRGVFCSLSVAKRVAFSFSYNEEGIEHTILELVSYLKSKEISFTGIGTVLLKTKKQVIHLDENITIIKASDCNYYGLPAEYKTSKLFVNEYDVFIDFNDSEGFVQQYIALKTPAKFKIGRYSSDNSPYDLVLEHGDGERDSKAFLSRIFFYLKSIKPD